MCSMFSETGLFHSLWNRMLKTVNEPDSKVGFCKECQTWKSEHAETLRAAESIT